MRSSPTHTTRWVFRRPSRYCRPVRAPMATPLSRRISNARYTSMARSPGGAWDTRGVPKRLRSDEMVSRVRTQPSAGSDRVRRAAIALFRELAYHGTWRGARAARLRVEVPSLYYHFASKQDILLDILDGTVD